MSLVFLVSAFAGCLGGPPAVQEDGLGVGSTQDVDNYDELNGTLGAIDGRVIREGVELPVSEAHVSIPGTNRFVETDAEGRFRFDELAPNVYSIRVDAIVDGREWSAEKIVNVLGGKALRVDIVLTLEELGIHSHDEWGDQKRILFQEPFAFSPQSEDSVTEKTGKWVCSTQAGSRICETQLPIDYSNRVRPGTSLVEVVLEWEPGDLLPPELGLRVTTTSNVSEDQFFLPRESGKPFRVAIFPNEADPGHQTFTQWTFHAVIPHANAYHPIGPLGYAGDAQTNRIQATIWIHKGVVPFEPAHRDFWKDASEILLFEGAALKETGATCITGCPYPNDGKVWAVSDGGLFVPPGTQEIRGELSWTSSNSLPQTAWGMAYKPANVPRGDSAFVSAPGTSAGQTYSFAIPVGKDESDQFYQVNSYWLFSPEDLNGYEFEDMHINSAYETHWLLTASAIRDPNYVFNG